jgi:hypothetical protein
MKKQTTGGTYDKNERFAYFLATSPTRHTEAETNLPDENIVKYEYVLIAVNELESKKSFEQLDKLIEEGRKVLIDSGIFNLTMRHARAHDVHMDVALGLAPAEIDGFDELKEKYYSVADKYKNDIWGMIEMDQGGAANKPITRAMIEKDTGIVPIPVWHPLLDGVEYYENLTAEYDRICVGNLVKAVPSIRLRLLTRIYELSREHPDVWHHLLGVTPSDLSYSLPIYGSCDSSTWLAGVRWMQGWKARATAKTFGNYPEDLWYGETQGTYYRVDGVSLFNSLALDAGVKDARVRRGQ